MAIFKKARKVQIVANKSLKSSGKRLTAKEFDRVIDEAIKLVNQKFDKELSSCGFLYAAKAKSTESRYFSFSITAIGMAGVSGIDAQSFDESKQYRISNHSKKEYSPSGAQVSLLSASDVLDDIQMAVSEILDDLGAKSGSVAERAFSEINAEIESFCSGILHQKTVQMSSASRASETKRINREKQVGEATTAIVDALTSRSGELYDRMKLYRLINKTGGLVSIDRRSDSLKAVLRASFQLLTKDDAKQCFVDANKQLDQEKPESSPDNENLPSP